MSDDFVPPVTISETWHPAMTLRDINYPTPGQDHILAAGTTGWARQQGSRITFRTTEGTTNDERDGSWRMFSMSEADVERDRDQPLTFAYEVLDKRPPEDGHTALRLIVKEDAMVTGNYWLVDRLAESTADKP